MLCVGCFTPVSRLSHQIPQFIEGHEFSEDVVNLAHGRILLGRTYDVAPQEAYRVAKTEPGKQSQENMLWNKRTENSTQRVRGRAEISSDNFRLDNTLKYGRSFLLQNLCLGVGDSGITAHNLSSNMLNRHAVIQA
jgi:hypothetical protein